MKKSILLLVLITGLMSFKSSAQTTVQLVDGTNTITLPGGSSLQFNFKGHYFSNMVFLDAAGTSHAIKTARSGVNGVAQPSCGADKVKELWASYQKDIGVCICKPKPKPNGAGDAHLEFDMTIDMPGNSTGKAQNRRVEVKLSK